jgi:hypothetical protein
LPPPFAAGFFLAVAALLGDAARDFVAAGRARLAAARAPSLVAAALGLDAGAGFAGPAAPAFVDELAAGFAADADAGFAADFLARSRVLAFPPVRGSFGIGSSLERTPAASALCRRHGAWAA